MGIADIRFWVPEKHYKEDLGLLQAQELYLLLVSQSPITLADL